MYRGRYCRSSSHSSSDSSSRILFLFVRKVRCRRILFVLFFFFRRTTNGVSRSALKFIDYSTYDISHRRIWRSVRPSPYLFETMSPSSKCDSRQWLRINQGDDDSSSCPVFSILSSVFFLVVETSIVNFFLTRYDAFVASVIDSDIELHRNVKKKRTDSASF